MNDLVVMRGDDSIFVSRSITHYVWSFSSFPPRCLEQINWISLTTILYFVLTWRHYNHNKYAHCPVRSCRCAGVTAVSSSPARGRSSGSWCRPRAPPPARTRSRNWQSPPGIMMIFSFYGASGKEGQEPPPMFGTPVPGTTGRPARTPAARPRHPETWTVLQMFHPRQSAKLAISCSHRRRPGPRPRHTARWRAACRCRRTAAAAPRRTAPAPTAAPRSPGPIRGQYCGTVTNQRAVSPWARRCARWSRTAGPSPSRSTATRAPPRDSPRSPRTPRRCSAASWRGAPAWAARCRWQAWRC